MIISKTPVRISLFGGGTDYPDFYLRHRGAVLGTTIDKYVYLSANKLSPFFDYKIKLSYSLSEKVKQLEEIQHPSVRECLKYKQWDEGLDLHVFADLPARTGLGSSSAFTVGLLNCLYLLNKQKTQKEDLAKEAIHIEQQLIQERVGSQDQVHASYGGFNVIEFYQDQFKVIPIEIEEENKRFLESNLMLFYTGINRYADVVLKEQVKNTKAGHMDCILKKMYEMVYEAKDILLTQSKESLLNQLGDLLDQSWQLKKQLSTKVSNPHIDQIYALAKQHGAISGKLCGAGHGGFLLFIVPTEKQAAVRSALKHLIEVDFKFENHGSHIIYQQ